MLGKVRSLQKTPVQEASSVDVTPLSRPEAPWKASSSPITGALKGRSSQPRAPAHRLDPRDTKICHPLRFLIKIRLRITMKSVGDDRNLYPERQSRCAFSPSDFSTQSALAFGEAAAVLAPNTWTAFPETQFFSQPRGMIPLLLLKRFTVSYQNHQCCRVSL